MMEISLPVKESIKRNYRVVFPVDLNVAIRKVNIGEEEEEAPWYGKFICYRSYSTLSLDVCSFEPNVVVANLTLPE